MLVVLFLSAFVTIVNCQRPWLPVYGEHRLLFNPEQSFMTPHRRTLKAPNLLCGNEIQPLLIGKGRECYKCAGNQFYSEIFVFNNNNWLVRKTAGALVNPHYVLTTATGVLGGECYGILPSALCIDAKIQELDKADITPHKDFTIATSPFSNIAIIKLRVAVDNRYPIAVPSIGESYTTYYGEIFPFYSISYKGTFVKSYVLVRDYGACAGPCDPHISRRSGQAMRSENMCVQVADTSNVKLYGFLVINRKVAAFAYCYNNNMATTMRLDNYREWIAEQIKYD